MKSRTLPGEISGNQQKSEVEINIFAHGFTLNHILVYCHGCSLYGHTHYVVEIMVEIQKSTEISYPISSRCGPLVIKTIQEVQTSIQTFIECLH